MVKPNSWRKDNDDLKGKTFFQSTSRVNYGRFVNEVKRETPVANIPLMHLVNVSKLRKSKF